MSEQGQRIFDTSATTVVAGAACTWCEAGVGDPCLDQKHGTKQPAPHTHAQRWYDYWNATHPPRERIRVYSAAWVGSLR